MVGAGAARTDGLEPAAGVQFGFMLPQVFTQSAIDPAAVRRVARQAEQAGFHSLWTQSRLVGEATVLEPLTLLSYVAGITERVRLGTSVLIVTEHMPVQLAKLISSLDVLSSGRTIIGLGTGSPAMRLSIGGWEMDRPVRRLIESVAMMSALWGDEPADVEGEIWQLRGAEMKPKPAQRPRPPLWLCGRHPNALRRAVRLGDGWMGPGAGSIVQFGEIVAQLRRELDLAGRDPATFPIAKRLYVAVEDKQEEAERRLRQHFTVYSNDADLATRACVYGTVDDIREQVQGIVDLGARLVVLNPVYDAVNQLDALMAIPTPPS